MLLTLVILAALWLVGWGGLAAYLALMDRLTQASRDSLASLGRSLQGPAAEKLTAFAVRQPRLQALGVLP